MSRVSSRQIMGTARIGELGGGFSALSSTPVLMQRESTDLAVHNVNEIRNRLGWKLTEH
jgi:hypothetical protein